QTEVERRILQPQSLIRVLKMAHLYSSRQFPTCSTICELPSHQPQMRLMINYFHACARQKCSFSMTSVRNRALPGLTRNSSNYLITVIILVFQPSSLPIPADCRESMSAYAHV